MAIFLHNQNDTFPNFTNVFMKILIIFLIYKFFWFIGIIFISSTYFQFFALNFWIIIFLNLNLEFRGKRRVLISFQIKPKSLKNQFGDKNLKHLNHLFKSPKGRVNAPLSDSHHIYLIQYKVCIFCFPSCFYLNY